MKFRKLRIAWSVGCAVACVLLLVLWVRSYWWQNVAIWQRDVCYKAASLQGRILFERLPYDIMTEEWTFSLTRLHDPVFVYQDDNGQAIDSYWFHIMRYEAWNQYVIPEWFIVLFTGCVAAAPWLRYRFSLRALLIATTLVAVVLGLIVWLGR